MTMRRHDGSQRSSVHWAKSSVLHVDAYERKMKIFFPLVRSVAWRYAHGRHGCLELEDLISVGTIGLLDAFRRYDPSRHTTLKTFAFHRIKGAILDELRKMNWVPRGTFQCIAKVRRATQCFEQQYGCHPSNNDLALKCQLTPHMINRILQDEEMARLMNSPNFSEKTDDLLFADQASGPLEAMEEKEVQKIIARKIKSLPYPQNVVLAEYYFEERKMKDIAKDMKVTESRVSQIHSQAIRDIRRRGDWDCFG